jgi:hypothetical protein
MTNNPKIDRIFFHGGSFGMLGYLGVIQALNGHPPPGVWADKGNSHGRYNDRVAKSSISARGGLGEIDDSVVTIPNYISNWRAKCTPLYGVSSGALTILLLVLDIPFERIYSIFCRCATAAHIGMIGGDISLTHQHYSVFAEIFDLYPNAFKTMNDANAHVGITTRLGFKWISEFASNADLQEVMLGSFHIPILCTHDPRYRGELVLDGGFGFDERIFVEKYPDTTLTISPNVSTPASIQCKVPFLDHIIPTYNHESRMNIIMDAYNEMARLVGRVTCPVTRLYPPMFEKYMDYIWYLRGGRATESPIPPSPTRGVSPLSPPSRANS